MYGRFGLIRKRYLLWLLVVAVTASGGICGQLQAQRQPNILLAISDDQSFAHNSRIGAAQISTPGFDRIAKEGIWFVNAVAASPGCSPSRASLLTGRYPWQNQQAGTHASSFPISLKTYPELLQHAGYHVGYTGKPWGPGNWKISGRTQNPAGPAYDKHKAKPPGAGISNKDYASNFKTFLESRQEDQPFCFWFGGHEPHRGFEAGIGIRLGKDITKVDVPSFLPDVETVRSDVLDYYVEIEHFDSHLSKMIDLLEELGELDNTLIVVTSDNGMAFPRAKANCYEYGIHVPLAIRWGDRIKPEQSFSDMVSFVDLAPTFLNVAGVAVPSEMQGRSLVELFDKGTQYEQATGADAEFVFSSRERHSSSRYDNWTYPQRAMRSNQHLLIRNFKPNRWPAGDPQKYDSPAQLGREHGGYHDIDACPTLTVLVEGRKELEIGSFFHLAVDHRPAWELFDILADPACLNNLIDQKGNRHLQTRLQRKMLSFLKETGDPRVGGDGDIWESYKRYSAIRKFPAPDSVPQSK
jgi:N-sulfoglucosamine sulfohydrolase|tara:strand:- start:2918 stop:4489 length:1572 start_codon:yes stop_codon:yes gene_type:complete